MAVREVPERVGEQFGMTDTDGRAELKILKAVDVTEELPGLTPGVRCVMVYTRSNRGRVVRIEGGSGRNLYVDELHGRCGDNMTVLSSLGRLFGLTPQKVTELIVIHAPA